MRICLYFFLIFTNCFLFGQETSYQAACIGFYNFENLFDTEDDPEIQDEEFTPKGKKRWDTKSYSEKLDNMAKVVQTLGTNITPDGPAILGICEVENKKVLEDFVANPVVKDRNYQIVHHNSSDKRGIDVALIYQQKYFKFISQTPYELKIYDKDGSRRYTRDILLVSGEFQDEKMHILLNHWPSRSGGENRAKASRNKAGEINKMICDSLYKDDPQAKIVIMGDLNDDPNSPSVKKHLQAKSKKSALFAGNLYNPLCEFYKKGLGTTAWRDSWSLFDQIIISQSFLEESNQGYKFYKAEVFRKPWLLQKSGQYAGYPFRTFQGDTYQGGYSDHLPVLIYLVKEVK